MSGSCLYVGEVTHRRWRPVDHRLRYRIFQVYLDLDEGAVLNARLRLFGFNRPGLASFHERDHGDRSATPLKQQIEALVTAAGHETGGPVRVLCLPRVLGFVFNPISIFYCHAADGRLTAIVYEVNNTFGDRTAYVTSAERRPHVDKTMHVSPFMEMDHRYHFSAPEPGERASLAIQVRRGETLWLSAAMTAERRPLSDLALLGAILSIPFVTIKVVAAIHWEAVRLWLKGLRFRPKPHGRVQLGTPASS